MTLLKMNKLSFFKLNFMNTLKLFLIVLSTLSFACVGNTLNNKQRKKVKPNIIYIYTDQQSETMMSCAGNKYMKTPAMDYIANNGIRFTRAYTTNPVCSPARVSMMTGRFPGYFDDNKVKRVRENGGAVKIPEVSQKVKNTTIAAFLKKAGYDLVYGGKEHLPPSLTPAALGFNDITDESTRAPPRWSRTGWIRTVTATTSPWSSIGRCMPIARIGSWWMCTRT